MLLAVTGRVEKRFSFFVKIVKSRGFFMVFHKMCHCMNLIFPKMLSITYETSNMKVLSGKRDVYYLEHYVPFLSKEIEDQTVLTLICPYSRA